MSTRPSNRRVNETDPGRKQPNPISDPTRKTHPKSSTTTTSTIFNLTNHFSKSAKIQNPLPKNDLNDTHLKVKPLSKSVSLESQTLKLGFEGQRVGLNGVMGKSMVVGSRKSDVVGTQLKDKGFCKSVNLESQTLELGFKGDGVGLGSEKGKYLVGVKKSESENDFEGTHLMNKGFNKPVNLETQTLKLGFEGKRVGLGGKKEKSLVVIDRGNDFADTHVKVGGLSRSVNLESQTLKLGFEGGKDPQTLKLGFRSEKEKSLVVVKNENEVMMGKKRSLCDVKMELFNFMVTNSAKVVSSDMPPFMQIHVVGFARKIKDSLEKFTSKSLALSLKREFDEVYGPAWHCVVGTSFGSFVTHSLGGFMYFALDQKWFILFFKTNVNRSG